MTRRQPSLRDICRDTPDRPMSPADEEFSAFLQSLPPPPMPVRHADARPWTDSQVHDIEMLQQEMRNAMARQAAEKISEAEKRAADAEKRLAEQRKWWADLAKSIIGPLVVAAIIGVVAVVWELVRAIR